MPKINLSDEEISKVIECLESQSEIPEELLMKLSPGFFEKLRVAGKFDYKSLDRMKIPTIEYAGKRSEAVILAQAPLTGGAAPLQIVRSFANGKNGDWKNLIVQGDNLQFLKTCYMNQDTLIKDKVKGKVKLFYNDPPFGTGDEYGGKDGEMSYSARLMGAEYTESLRERLIYCRELLDIDGSIFIRIDYHFGHYIKLVLDEIFGKENFLNEIIINRIKKSDSGAKKYNVATDSLFFYSKSSFYKNKFKPYYKELKKEKKDRWHAMDSQGQGGPAIILGKEMYPPRGRHWTFGQENIYELEKNNRIKLSKTGKPQYLIDSTTEILIDSNWTDIPGYSTTSGYPTENSEDVLERVIKSCSDENDLVMDIFGGSGTTAAVAEKLGRRWIICDFGKHSIYTIQKRILNIAESKELGNNKKIKYGKTPRPFCVVSTGAYDFSKIMNLRKNKDAYISFVLGLFNIQRENKDFTKKYKVNNIFAEKENNPVEIYPVWEDEYLNNIKIDDEYLNEIINSSGDKLRGNYYIIVPDACAVINDTKINNTNFKLLKYPYKVLEEFARQFEIDEQPSSQSDINKLISSTALYFNQEVLIKTERQENGIKILEFKTNILNKQKEKFEGLEGLALILVDNNYDGKIFEMGTAIYSKEIKDGVFKVEGLTDSTYIIAIDKHGNESKPSKI